MNSVATAAAFAVLCASAPALAEGITVTKNGPQPVVRNPAENFTGNVHTTSRFSGTAPSRLVGSTVVFEPGARTAWHTHPLGQTLIVTEGTGLVGLWEGDVQTMSKGDVVWIPAGVKHWHSASGDEGSPTSRSWKRSTARPPTGWNTSRTSSTPLANRYVGRLGARKHVIALA